MTLINFPSKQNNASFFNEMLEEGYHIFSLDKAKTPDYYPNKFPEYPGVSLQDLQVGEVITIRAFFRVGSGKNIQVDGGYLDLEVEFIEGDTVWGVIRTELPKGFPLETGSSIEIFKDEILYKNEPIKH